VTGIDQVRGASYDAPRAIHTALAASPAGTYNQAVAAGEFVFISGQTPRLANGDRLLNVPFGEQASAVLDNLEAIAAAAGLSLGDAVNVTVYLSDPTNAAEFARLYKTRVGSVLPARAIVQSSLTVGALEVTAVLYQRTVGGPS
jgi:2-iminobutanoate/2-iminopropanoate deaminase